MKLLTLVTLAAAPVIGAGLAGVAGLDSKSQPGPGGQGAISDAVPSKRDAADPVDPLKVVSRSLGSAHDDPFFSVPKPAPAVVILAPPAPVVAPPPPPPPPFPYRFVGRVTGPDNEPVIYLAKGERLVTVRDKSDLGDGYRVEELTDRHLVVVHDASQQKNTIEFGAEPGAQRAP
jgi:hypothetical protein